MEKNRNMEQKKIEHSTGKKSRTQHKKIEYGAKRKMKHGTEKNRTWYRKKIEYGTEKKNRTQHRKKKQIIARVN